MSFDYGRSKRSWVSLVLVWTAAGTPVAVIETPGQTAAWQTIAPTIPGVSNKIWSTSDPVVVVPQPLIPSGRRTWLVIGLGTVGTACSGPRLYGKLRQRREAGFSAVGPERVEDGIPCEAALRRLLEMLGADHPRCVEALGYQQRLREDLDKANRFG